MCLSAMLATALKWRLRRCSSGQCRGRQRSKLGTFARSTRGKDLIGDDDSSVDHKTGSNKFNFDVSHHATTELVGLADPQQIHRHSQQLALFGAEVSVALRPSQTLTLCGGPLDQIYSGSRSLVNKSSVGSQQDQQAMETGTTSTTASLETDVGAPVYGEVYFLRMSGGDNSVVKTIKTTTQCIVRQQGVQQPLMTTGRNNLLWQWTSQLLLASKVTTTTPSTDVKSYNCDSVFVSHARSNPVEITAKTRKYVTAAAVIAIKGGLDQQSECDDANKNCYCAHYIYFFSLTRPASSWSYHLLEKTVSHISYMVLLRAQADIVNTPSTIY